MNLKQNLEKLYKQYNKREYVHPDPLEFLYRYKKIEDREIVGLIASSLAYGRVNQILKSVSGVLSFMGHSPKKYIEISSEQKIKKDTYGFKHRFTTDVELYRFLIGIKKILKEYGSIENVFGNCNSSLSESLKYFVNIFHNKMNVNKTSLLADPNKNSACKRLYLFLRWMVRKDDVDPGGWKSVKPSELIVPLDTHMFQIGKMLGLTCRKQADLRSAIEITDGFKKYCIKDPVKYDFVLTRFGIRVELDYNQLRKKCGI